MGKGGAGRDRHDMLVIELQQGSLVMARYRRRLVTLSALQMGAQVVLYGA